MEKIDSLQQQLFQECMEVLQHLAGTSSAEELISRQHLIMDVSEHISFMKLLNQHKNSLVSDSVVQHSENETLNLISETADTTQPEIIHKITETEKPTETILEKAEELPLIITNPEAAHLEAETKTESDDLPIEPAAEIHQEETPEVVTEDIIVEPIVDEQPDAIHEEIVEELVAESTLTEESYERAVEVKERETPEEESHEVRAEKKFKLANIKGLSKNIHSLFDEPQVTESNAGIAKSNMPLDFMEAGKLRPDFKLDLNDRIAFTQNLFGGSQTELNETIHHLNSFKTLDEAKEYLSDIYYQRNWKKADDYAQRLWTLVENKFL